MIIIIPIVFSVRPVAGSGVVIFLPEQILAIRPGIFRPALIHGQIKTRCWVFQYINV